MTEVIATALIELAEKPSTRMRGACWRLPLSASPGRLAQRSPARWEDYDGRSAVAELKGKIRPIGGGGLSTGGTGIGLGGSSIG